MKKAVSLVLALLMVLCLLPAASAANATIKGAHDVTIYRVENNVTDYATVLASKKNADMPATLSIVKPYNELGLSQGGKFEGEVALVEVHATLNSDFSGEGAEVTVNGKAPALVAEDKVVFYATLDKKGGINGYAIEASKPYAEGDAESGKVTESFKLYIDYTNSQKANKTLNIAAVSAPDGADYTAYMVAGKLDLDFEGEAHWADVSFTFADENKAKFTEIAYATAITGSTTGEQKLASSKATFQIDGTKLQFQVETAKGKHTSVEIPVVFRSNIQPADPKGVYFANRSMTIKIGQTVTPAVKTLNNAAIKYTLDYADASSSAVGIDGKSVIGLKEGVAYITLTCTAGGNTYTDTMKVIVTGDSYVEPSKAYVTASALNVRKGAGTSYARIGWLHEGDEVTVLSVSGGWAQIAWGNGTAYVSAKYLTDVQAEADTYYVVCRALNVRKGAGTSYARIGKLYRGDKVEVLSMHGGWAKITWGEGTAYVSATYLSK